MYCSSKKTGKGKRPGKGGNRYFKNVGLGFKTPREAIDGTTIMLFSKKNCSSCSYSGVFSMIGRCV